MKNLKTALLKEEKAALIKNILELKNEQTIDSILSKWFYEDKIPVSSKNREWKDVKELKEYLITRMKKTHEQRINERLNKIDRINNSLDIESITISVDWKKSRMWGNNAKAEIVVRYKNKTVNRFESSRTSGCGYDKESTAIAGALNQCDGILKRLYKVKNKNTKASNRNLIGYGSGYGLLPSFEGGVGVSCMYRICEAIGLNFENIANGNNFSVYKISIK